MGSDGEGGYGLPRNLQLSFGIDPSQAVLQGKDAAETFAPVQVLTKGHVHIVPAAFGHGQRIEHTDTIWWYQ